MKDGSGEGGMFEVLVRVIVGVIDGVGVGVGVKTSKHEVH